MSDFRGKPSGWLLRNSNGFPDFLFTILTYSMVLLAFVTLMWVTFGILAYFNSNPAKAEVILQIMDSLKTGLISLVGVVFGLAGSYTVRRFKKDDHYIEKKKLEQANGQEEPTEFTAPAQEGLKLVHNEEDI